MGCLPRLFWAKTEDGRRYSTDIAMRCLLCEDCIKPKTTNTAEWYCASCRKNLDDAKDIVLSASGKSPSNRVAHYLTDPVGYQERVEVGEASEWLQSTALIREVQQRRDAMV